MLKKYYSTALLIIGVFCGLSCMFVPQNAVAAKSVIIKKGVAKAKIYHRPFVIVEGRKRNIQANDNNYALTVADLNYHLKAMSGTELEIVVTNSVDGIKAPAIVLGELAIKMGAKPPKSKQGKEGFNLLVKDGLILIGGESKYGTICGIYEMLEQLGCDWVMPGKPGEIIPKRKTVFLPNLDIKESPAFEYRNLWYRGGSRCNTKEDNALFAEWKRRQRMSLYRHHLLDAGGHVWDQLIRKNKELFEENPDMLALVRGSDGKMVRKGPQIETTSPKILDLFAKRIEDKFKKMGWKKDHMASFGIGPADGLGYSQSIESQNAGSARIDPMMGDPDVTDLVIKLGNDILAKVLDEYPNVYLGYYVYSVHADYPARYTPHPHIVPIAAPISYSRAHCMTDKNSKTRTYYRNIMEQWIRLHKAQGNEMFFRGYNWNLAENMVPFTRLKMWGVDIPWYKRAGMIGMNVEATKSWSVNGAHDYLYAKLIWNADLDWHEVLADYCKKAFGPASDIMQDYYLKLVENQHEAGQEAGSYHAIHLIFSDQFVTDSLKRLRQAHAKAKTDQQRTLIEFATIPMEELQMYLTYHKQTLDFDFAAAKATLAGISEHWQKAYDRRTDIVAKEVLQYFKRFLSKFIDSSCKYSEAPYSIAYRLPDSLKTMFDQTGNGHLMGYQNPELNDRDYIKTKTISTTWDAQGLSGLRKAAVWYRVHYTPDMSLKGKAFGLFLGGVEDEARVWCNGDFIGSGRGFSLPFVYDLTDSMVVGKDNVVAIQVIRNSSANEIGVGGILRPSFIFTGPRLEQKAPKQIELGRVLPGGEIEPIKE